MRLAVRSRADPPRCLVRALDGKVAPSPSFGVAILVCAVLGARSVSCTFPVKGYRGPDGRFVMASKDSPSKAPLEVPCGRCMSCRVAKRREWGLRCAHEAKMHDASSFLTLTYSEENLPSDGSVSKRELQLFMKRLRTEIAPRRVRFIACGEYGSQLRRPHYHVGLFGYGFPDRKMWMRAKSGALLYRSAELERVWPFGHALVGALTAESAAYVAGYVCKKITGDAAEQHYTRVDPATGEVRRLGPEFLVSSNRPGIGVRYAEKWMCDWVDSGYFVLDGVRRPVPAYYRRRLRAPLTDDEVVLPIERNAKLDGMERRDAHPEEQTEARREVRDEVLRLRLAGYERDGFDSEF